MTEKQKPSMWTRLKWVFTGKPVSHQEYQAARAQHAIDIATQVQHQARNQRFGAGGMI